MAFVHSRLRWFEAPTCMATPRGHLSSLIQHSSQSLPYWLSFRGTPPPANLVDCKRKITRNPIKHLDAISRFLSETRLNSSVLGLARFANGIGFHAISFTTIPIWQFMDLSVQCISEIEFMASNTQHYPALYIIFILLNLIRRGIPHKNT